MTARDSAATLPPDELAALVAELARLRERIERLETELGLARQRD